MKGILKYNEPLAPHTSWHIGGKADKYYCPADLDDLTQFLMGLPKEEPLFWLGLGSNVLIPDEGLRGTVIHTAKMPGKIEKISNTRQGTQTIRVEMGTTCAKVAKYCAKEGLMGGEFFAGIPGTVGGALFMNAGAFGGETWEKVVSVEVIDRNGTHQLRPASDYKIAYRSVQGPKDEWFLAGHFQFAPGDSLDAAAKIKALLKKRSETQPIGVFSCGSVFKNPENDYAARLIESSGLKGFTIGGAQVSPKHANFIINLGNARATDVLQLIEHIMETVWKNHQIRLQPEVRIV